jgi:hypothetical protein
VLVDEGRGVDLRSLLSIGILTAASAERAAAPPDSTGFISCGASDGTPHRGAVAIWLPGVHEQAVATACLDADVTSLAGHPVWEWVALGTVDGGVTCLQLV